LVQNPYQKGFFYSFGENKERMRDFFMHDIFRKKELF